MKIRLVVATALLSTLNFSAQAQTQAKLDPPAWTHPVPPFRIVGDIWYVGTEGLAAYLVKTSGGAILIDTTMRENAPTIERNILATGTRLRDVRYILLSHAHFDHVGGAALIKAATGAKLVAGARDAQALESGTPPGETSYGVIKFDPVNVNRAMGDGETVRLGGTVLSAVATPGHTPGCTTWVTKSGKLRIVFPCSLSVAGNKLIGNSRYPDIVSDFRSSFAKLATVGADVVLPNHPELADVISRHKNMRTFVAPELLAGIVDRSRIAFETELANQENRSTQ